MNNTKLVAFFVIAITALTSAGTAYAQETPEIEIEFSPTQLLIVVIGVFAGLVTAYNGYRKAKIDKPDEKFDIGKFLDRVIIAIIASVPIAIGEAAGLVTLDLFGAILIFLAALGSAELVMEIRTRNTK